MKKRLLPVAAKLVAVLALVLCLLPVGASAVTTTTLLTQNFSSGVWPPTGWSTNLNSTSYGWYYSPYDEINPAQGQTGTTGCAMMSAFYMYDYGYNNIYLQSPAFNGSAYGTSVDSMFVDFDLFMPENYYTYYDASCCNYYAYLQVIVGGTDIKQISQYTNYTFFDQEYGFITYPSGSYESSAYWAHWHIQIPNSLVSSSMTVQFNCQSAGGYLPDNFGIDNIIVTNNRYTSATESPAAMNFGSLGTGLTSATQYEYITNPNATAITVSGVQLVGSNPGDFIITRTPTVIAAGKKDSIGVAFSPTAGGIRSAVLAYNVNVDIGGSATVSLQGTGLVPTISISPFPLLPFAGLHVKFYHSASYTIYVTNSGHSPLIINPVTTAFSGTDAAMYSFSHLPSQPIQIGATDSIVVTFTPTIEGGDYAVLTINSNASNGAQTVTLYGLGVLPHLAVTPVELNFDSVAMGTSQTDSIKLFNPGSDTLVITNNLFTSADGDFTIGALSGAATSIPPDQYQFVPVTFTPRQNGVRQARYRITTNIPLTETQPQIDTSTFYVNIYGEGVPFGSLAVAGTPIQDSEIIGHTICSTDTLYNNGTAPLTITGYVVNGTDSAQFAVSGVTTPLTIPAGGHVIFNVCATPTSRGLQNANLSVVSMTNGRASNASLSLSVFGQSACASVGGQNTGLPAYTCIGSSDTAWVTVTNCGDVTSVYNAAFSGGAKQYAFVGANISSSIASNGTTKFGVIFTPDTVGAAAGTVTITGTGGVLETVNLDGTGGGAASSGSSSGTIVQIGKTGTIPVTVTNNGTCDWAPGTAPVFTGATDFAFVAADATVIIGAGKTGVIHFTYSPTVAGTDNATVTFPNETEASFPAASVTLSATATTTSVERLTAIDGYSLDQNYPNPFNPTTEIRFTLPKASHVSIDIVDLTGRVVRNVMSEEMTAGNHGTVVDAGDLASGVYYYQLTAGSIKLSRQMILTK